MAESLLQEVTEEALGIGNWRPHKGAQTRFLQSPAYEVLFGGAAGGGKTMCLVMDALRQTYHPKYRGVIFRRTTKELNDADGPIQKSHEWYPHLGGTWREGKQKWIFKSGAEIYFHHMEHEKDRFIYQGAAYQFIGFDELTHFQEVQYTYLMSRCRTTIDTGLDLYVRAATNPGGLGHDWVKERFINTGIRDKIGWFRRINDEDVPVPMGTQYAKSRSFIPATIFDNPTLSEEYIANLHMLDEVERKRLLDGDWDAEYKGRIFPQFGEENISHDAEFDPNYPVEWFVDDGIRNPRAILFVQERPFKGIPDCLVVFDEHYKSGQGHDEAIQECLAKSYPEPDLVYYDPSAAFLANRLAEFDLTHIQGYNDVQEGIKGVRMYIKFDDEIRLLYIHPRCKNLIREIKKYIFDENKAPTKGGDPPPLKKDDHTVDALRYGIATNRMWNLIGLRS